jgi:DNA-binding transcriptional MocR family regulator
VLADNPVTVLGDESYEGYEPFREWLASFMTKRGVPSTRDNVLTVAGYREGLALVCRTLLESDHAVAFENPTSTANISLLRSIGATVYGIPMTSSGIDVDELDRLAAKFKVGLMCVRSMFHDPTGVVIAQDAREAVLNIDSLCRLLFPDTRTGWIVGSRDLVSRLSSVKRVMDLRSRIVMESACYEFCRAGYLLNHVRRMRKVHQRRRQAMLDALERYMPKTVAWHVAEGRLTVWLTLPRRTDSQVIYEKAREAGVLVTPGRVFFVDGGGQRNLRLTYGSVDESRLDGAIGVLGRLSGALVRRASS